MQVCMRDGLSAARAAFVHIIHIYILYIYIYTMCSMPSLLHTTPVSNSSVACAVEQHTDTCAHIQHQQQQQQQQYTDTRTTAIHTQMPSSLASYAFPHSMEGQSSRGVQQWWIYTFFIHIRKSKYQFCLRCA